MTLYLIPTPIGELDPTFNREIINSLAYFVVENVRTARRMLAPLKLDRKIDEITFVELNEHTPTEDIAALFQSEGDFAIMSEAGLPCIADPGALLVAEAHRRGVEVVPLVGASSLMLALMGSGMNGQSFAFNGYLPVKQPDRGKAIRHFERRAATERQTQIFIETPYRNDALLKELVASLGADAQLCVAVGLMSGRQRITTRTVAAWRRSPLPVIGKVPAVFLIGY